MKLSNAALKDYIDCYRETRNEGIAEYLQMLYEIDIHYYV